MSNYKCERCGQPLKGLKIKMLELSLTDGNYYDTIPKGHKSQGFFPFGISCASLQLKDTIYSLQNPELLTPSIPIQ